MPAPPLQTLHEQLRPLFDARTVAIVGASNTPGKWGHMLMERPIKGGFTGTVIPVHPRETEVMGLRAYPSVLAIPEPVDLAVLTVPATAAAQVLRECGQKGIRAAVVISAGFAESGPEGELRQAELLRVAQDAGIRFVGPNCNGMWSASAGLSLHSPKAPMSGPIAFVSQSGAFGGSLIEAASRQGYGVSRFVSTGNQADLNDADYLEYLGDDPETDVIACYIEGLRDARRFLETARRVVARKPVLVYKAGRNAVGARAVHSHTASLMMPDDVFDAACRQFGLLRVHEAMHLFAVAAALADAPLPRGPRVAVMSMTGGQCVVTADNCAQLGMEVPELDGATQSRLAAMLADHAPTPRNPVDLAGDFRDVALFADVAELLADLPYIDALIVAGPGGGSATDERVRATAERMARIPARTGKPLVAVGVRRMADGVVPEVFRAHHVPCYETPEESARAMHGLVRYAQIRRELHDL
ncbi:MAG: CoA-binding protein [Chloroflexi bacterium]|nr:CoA-binding protein [Chloroflexota bacterium]